MPNWRLSGGHRSPSAERLARRRGWPRQVGNDGVVRVLVPLTEARNISTSAASGVASVTLAASPPASPGQMTPNDRGLRGAIQTLREQLAKADQREESERRRAEHELALTNNSLVSERDRAEEMERHVNELMAERRQTHASPPDVRSVIKEVIREIAGGLLLTTGMMIGRHCGRWKARSPRCRRGSNTFKVALLPSDSEPSKPNTASRWSASGSTSSRHC